MTVTSHARTRIIHELPDGPTATYHSLPAVCVHHPVCVCMCVYVCVARTHPFAIFTSCHGAAAAAAATTIHDFTTVARAPSCVLSPQLGSNYRARTAFLNSCVYLLFTHTNE
uniref:(northern house mosquito) hypothetical protein n=1 Tax=Culex pipiens TaxID=7175 RepID=A0A8D8PFP5_CULPI